MMMMMMCVNLFTLQHPSGYMFHHIEYVSLISLFPFFLLPIVNENKKQPNKIPTIVENERRLETDDDKANAFGRKLELTFSDLPDSDQLCNTGHKSYVEDYVAKFMDRNLGEAVEPITIAELNNAISNLNNKISIIK